MQKAQLTRMFSESDHEIELYSNSRERQQYDEQANLYAIITATEHLERAYAKDDVTREEVS
jgi:ESCRT-I complex subunit VPS28